MKSYNTDVLLNRSPLVVTETVTETAVSMTGTMHCTRVSDRKVAATVAKMFPEAVLEKAHFNLAES